MNFLFKKIEEPEFIILEFFGICGFLVPIYSLAYYYSDIFLHLTDIHFLKYLIVISFVVFVLFIGFILLARFDKLLRYPITILCIQLFVIICGIVLNATQHFHTDLLLKVNVFFVIDLVFITSLLLSHMPSKKHRHFFIIIVLFLIASFIISISLVNRNKYEIELSPTLFSETTPKDYDYVLNVGTGVYHEHDCYYLNFIDENRKAYIYEWKTMMDAKYSPCKKCCL